MSRAVDHVHMGDGKTLALDQRRHETVEGVEIRQAQIDVAPEGLEAAAGIPRSVLEDPPPHAIGNPATQALISAGYKGQLFELKE